MIINDKQLYIPPIISTSWDNILLLYVVEGQLMVHLKDHKVVPISGLAIETMEKIFDMHSRFLSNATTKSFKNPEASLAKALNNLFNATQDGQITMPIRLSALPTDAFPLGASLQHNPSQSDFPSLPQEAVDKISLLAKALPLDGILSMPPPQEECNCLYCQVLRIMRQTTLAENHNVPDHPTLNASSDEPVKDEELQFQQWDILKVTEQVYTVTNRLDSMEQYQVHLGNPIGCTCGRQECDHILAVLKS